jgi:SAM-dependent methyltransferase
MHGYDPFLYEVRYRKVYEAGAEFWEKPVPTDVLIDFIGRYRRELHGGIAVEFGCGEGRNAIYLAKEGFRVLCLDVASLAIAKASRFAKAKSILNIDFMIADAVNPGIRNNCFDLAVDIALLHIIIDPEVRGKYLHEVLRILKPGGLFFICNLASDKPVTVNDFYRDKPKPGTLIPRRIIVGNREKEILLPIIPAWPRTLKEYVDELQRAGFEVVEAFRKIVNGIGDSCIIVARKKTAFIG